LPWQELDTIEPRTLIECPTAGLLPRGSFDFDVRIFPNGGMLSGVSIGLMNRLLIGFSFGGEQIIGDGSVIAAAVGTPVVALFGPTTPALGFVPYGPGHTILEVPLDCRPCGRHAGQRYPKRHFRCMRDIAPERVFEKIAARLSQT